MSEYIATFITGFGKQIKAQIRKDLPGIAILGLYDGLIHFKYAGKPAYFDRLIYLNNVFFVIKSFKGKSVSFTQMAETVCRSKQILLISRGTFRIRYSMENQFVKADSNLTKKVERHILNGSRLLIDRVNPTTEIWFIIRNEGIAFCGQLLYKRKTTEKSLNKGELRPEFAYLMCLCADLNSQSIVYDPFCGYGSIPKQLLTHFKVGKVIASDIEKEKVSALKKKLNRKNSDFECFRADALSPGSIPDKSVDVIITDPPWGYYEQIEDIAWFYRRMLAEFLRIGRPGCTIVLLSARKQEFTDACNNLPLLIMNRIETLVNGKKATVFILQPA